MLSALFFRRGLRLLVLLALLASLARATVIYSSAGALTEGDEFSYTINVNQSGTLHVFSTGAADTVGHLLNARGLELASDDDSGGGRQFSLSYSVCPGTYTIRVHGRAYAASGSFRLVADFTAPNRAGADARVAYAMRTDAISSPGVAAAGNSVPRITAFTVSPSNVSNGQAVQVVLNADDDGDMNAYTVRHVQFSAINPGGVGARPDSGTTLRSAFGYTIPGGALPGANVFRAEVGDSFSVPGNASTYAIQEYSVTVAGTPVNAPPQAVFNDGPVALPAGQSGSWSYAASDSNGNLARWSVRVLPDPVAWIPVSGSLQTSRANFTFPTPGAYTLRLDVEDSSGAKVTVDRSVTVTASNAPAITSPTAVAATFGVPYSYTITASNSPTSYGVVNLPPGLSFDASTRAITGTPTQVGVFYSTISASNANGTGSATLTTTVVSGTLSADVAMNAAVVRPASGATNHTVQLSGFSSLGNLTQYRYTLSRPDGSIQDATTWTAFALKNVTVWVSEGHFAQQWVEDGYTSSEWVEEGNWEWVHEVGEIESQRWVSSGEWHEGFWWSYYNDQGQYVMDIWSPPWYEDTSHWEPSTVSWDYWSYQWVSSGGHWEEVWVSTGGHYDNVWVDTSHWENQTIPQSLTTGAATKVAAISATAALGRYAVKLEVMTAIGQTTSTIRYFDVTAAAAPAVQFATAVTATSFAANWSLVTGATYQLDVSTNNFFASGMVLSSQAVGAPPFTVSGLAVNTPYYYRVRAVIAGGASVNSETVPVTTLPTIATAPTAALVAPGGTAVFNVVATAGPAALTYQWRKDGAALANGTSGGVTTTGATSPTLSIGNLGSGAAGEYSVVITNAGGSVTSTHALLTVGTAPVIATHPTSQAVNLNQTVTFAVVATGVPAPTYQWRKNGVDIVGATATSLTFSAAQASHAGIYTVVVSNPAGTVTSNAATLTVNNAPQADLDNVFAQLKIHLPN